VIDIRLITENKKDFLPLLLLGDELESNIDTYLERGEMFALYDGDVKSMCVVTDEGGGILEIQNIATDKRYQRMGYAYRLIEHVAKYYTGRYDKIILGTGDVPSVLAFYEHCGFTQTHRIADYFTTHFDYPIIEDGITLKDKVYLEKMLSEDKEKHAFLTADKYVDFTAENIRVKAAELFADITDDTQKARIAYEFVRDEIPHSFDINSKIITAKASDVLKHKTGICHAKANLLAALLRSQGIPTGFCFQHCTILDDDSAGYCVHCYNAVLLDGRWIKLDARGNKPGVNAGFSLEEPILAFSCRPQYDEYFWPGIYATPHAETMAMLEQADSLEYIIKNIPNTVTLPMDAEGDKSTVKVRAMQKSDYACLPECLYQAIFIPEGMEPPPRSVIDLPEIFGYIKDFGKQPGDLGVVAEQNEQIIGAAWTRIIPAYGHIDDETPELAISLLPEFRGYGIGTKLMKKLFEVLRQHGYKRTSLSVQTDNPAVRFYQRLGYEIIGEGSDNAGHVDYLT